MPDFSVERMTETTERMVEAFGNMGRVMSDAGRTLRALNYRICGWSDLANVITDQEGREIVRDGMHDIRVWLGEVTDDRQ